jgi:Domain of unknown function (DUF6916)
MLDTLRLEDFAPRIGERFRLSADAEHSIDVTLLEATALGAAARSQAARRAPFSVVFLGPAAPVWPQRIYRVEHDVIGSFDLFLVPLGPRDGGMMYEAVFT